MHLGLSHLLSVVLFQILTKDSVTVFVNAIMYYKVNDATSAVANVDDYSGSAQLLAATTLRNVLGTRQGTSWSGRGFTLKYSGTLGTSYLTVRRLRGKCRCHRSHRRFVAISNLIGLNKLFPIAGRS